MGTVYRNFPTKESLLEALLVARMEILIDAAQAEAEVGSPGDAFVGFLRRASDEFANSKALANAMASEGVDCGMDKKEVSGRLLEAVQGLLDRAQRAGQVRPDVTLSDVGALMLSFGQVDASVMDAAQRARCVDLVCDALLLR